MFLEQQISILEWFWRSCDSEDWRNDAENSAVHHRHEVHFKCINVVCISHLCESDEGLQLAGGDGCAVGRLVLFAQLQIEVLQHLRSLCRERGVNVVPGVTQVLPQELVRDGVKHLSRNHLQTKTEKSTLAQYLLYSMNKQ